MKAIVLAGVVAVIVSQALAFESISLHYHENVGIPEAARIKAAEDARDFNGARIVGGSPASVGAYPFLGGLLIFLLTGQLSVCGSTLLSNTRALTAAHCWNDGQNIASDVELVFGSVTLFTGGLRLFSSNVELHENYNPGTLQNDLAVITIPSILFTNAVSPITVPSGYMLWLSFVGNWVQAAGFGMTSDTDGITTAQTLSHVEMQVITNAACAQVYGPVIVTDSILCTSSNGRTGRVSTCGGDSGGPLSITISGESYLVGVTTFSHIDGCEAGHPSGFIRATEFVDWIAARVQ